MPENWNLPPLSALGFTPFQPPQPPPNIPPEMLLELLGNRPLPTPQIPPGFGDAGNIDYSERRLMRPPGPPAADIPTARSGYNPIADWMAQYGLSGSNPWHQLSRWAAPGVNRVEGAGRTVRNLAAEATGIPAAARAGQAFAEGETGRGITEGLAALPSRGAGLLSMLFGSAEAQPPDPRRTRIQALDKEIADRERAINDLGRRTRDPDRLEVLSRPHLEALTAIRAQRERLQGSIDAEADQKRLADEAASRGAAWRNTPSAQAHPWLAPTTATVGGVAGFVLPYTRARMGVHAYNTRVVELDRRWGEAVGRAQNTRLSPERRTQAANEARQLGVELQTALGETPRHSRLGAAFTGAATTDFGLMLPTGLDYVSSAAEPEGPLRRHTLDSLASWDTAGRLGLGFLGGGALGEIGNELGSLGLQRPTGYAAETAALPKQYRRQRRK